MIVAGVLVAHLSTVLTLSPAPHHRSTVSMVNAGDWHSAGAKMWNQMRAITPRSYFCRRVDPAKPVSLSEGDIRKAGYTCLDAPLRDSLPASFMHSNRWS